MEAAPEPFVTRLGDGLPVQIRALGPEDREAIREGLAHVGGRSLYERFLSPNHKPTDRELAYLSQPDQRDHLALALGTLDEPPVGIGVARCVRDAPGSDTAEYAILIRDDFQGRGAGVLLLAHLADHAQKNGIARFRGIQLVDNKRILALTEKVARMISRRVSEPGVLEVMWELDPELVRARLGERRSPAPRWRQPFEWLLSRFNRGRAPDRDQ